MRTFAEEPWELPKKIILGIDIGTTQSAVSFAFLYPGGPQSLYRISKWPGQDPQKGESKVPTIIYYDRRGEAVLFGAEAAKLTTAEAEEQGWRLARHFKLHLHPKAMQQKYNLKVQPLPDGISLEKVYSDFMVFLLQHTQETFESRVMGGADLWEELRNDMTIVLAHPNGWTIKEQNFLRQAAIAAKCTTEAKGHEQIHFVSEAEASMHFCMFGTDIHRRLEPGVGLVICDAGGSTIDTTAYRVKNTSPVLELEEMKVSACVQAGGVFVDLECEKHLKGVLDKIELDEEERNDYIQDGVKDFEAFAKQSFGLKGPHDIFPADHRIDMRCRLQRPQHNIRRGVITLTRRVVHFGVSLITALRRSLGAFDSKCLGLVPSVYYSLEDLATAPTCAVSYCLSLAALGALLQWLTNQRASLSLYNLRPLIRDNSSKAVADGAVIWSAKHSVVRRATRMFYGTTVNTHYDPRNPDHLGRTILKFPNEVECVHGRWSQIVGRGVVVGNAEAIREPYYSIRKGFNRRNELSAPIYAWTNDGRLNKGYEKICEIVADLSGMRQTPKKEVGPDGDYYKRGFNIALQFGGTELRAFLEWEEDGKTRTGPALIIPKALTVVQD
ncbi:hypothetical protein FRC12_003453 [Ceratobasidium sp. 428]|nr:hypothetical protein FRC12_003453 [Ceratobasidium sp. 428]